MNDQLRPHYFLIAVSTLKATAALLAFFLLALLLSPSKLASAYLLGRLFLLFVVLCYGYLFFFWHGVSFSFGEASLTFLMKAGRKNHIELPYEAIASLSLQQGAIERIFGVSRLSLTLQEENTYGSDQMVLNQYLVFDTKTAQQLYDKISAKVPVQM